MQAPAHLLPGRRVSGRDKGYVKCRDSVRGGNLCPFRQNKDSSTTEVWFRWGWSNVHCYPSPAPSLNAQPSFSIDFCFFGWFCLIISTGKEKWNFVWQILARGKKKKEKMIHSQVDISLLFFKLLNRKLMYLHNSSATTVTEAQEDGKSPMLACCGLRSDFCHHSKESWVSQHLLENLCGVLLGWKDVREHLCGGDNLITYRVESVYKWHGGEFEIVCVSRWLNRTPTVTLFCCLLQKTEWFKRHVLVKQRKN